MRTINTRRKAKYWASSCAFIALLAASSSPAFAQQTISENGQLQSGDEQLDDGEYFDTYTFEAREGQQLDLRLNSTQFDPYLAVRGPGDFSVWNDDISEGENSNSRITETIPVNGTYRVLVTSFAAEETGSYQLRGQVGGASSSSSSTQVSSNAGSRQASGRLETNDEQLSSGEYYDVFDFEANAGQRVTINADSSEFDAYLMLSGPDDFSVQNDDVTSGNLNAQISETLPASGTYRVSVTSATANETGRYSVRTSGPTLLAASGGNRALTSLAIGSTVDGQLANGDGTLSTGEFVDTYSLRGNPGEQFTVTLESSDFDAYLGAIGSGDYNQSNDDDSSGRATTNSRLDVVIPSDGTLRIAATSYAADETGSYRLLARRAGASSAQSLANAQNISLGQSANGSLASSDPEGSTSREDTFLLEVPTGQNIRLALSSSDFDPLLRIEGPNGFNTENDDSSAGGTLNSLIETELPGGGTYRVIVASYDEAGLGSYQLETASSSGASNNSNAAQGNLAVGTTQNGTLASGDATIPSGEFYDAYQFTGRRGQRVTIDLASSEFDAYLSLLYPSGGQEENDDATGTEGQTNSRLSMVLPEDGTYQLVATSYQPGETGSYSISLNEDTSQAGPVIAASGSSRVFALSVGVADYDRMGSLSLTDQDATKLSQTLRATGRLADQSVTLVNRQATRANFIEAIDDIAGVIGPDDLFLLFFSGHGSKENVETFIERDGSSETIELFDASVSDYELSQMLDQMNAQTLLVLDSCFSGGFDDVVSKRTGRMGVFSSDSDLTSLVASKFEAGGYISHILQLAMEGEADTNGDTAITAGELSDYMRTKFYQITLAQPLRTTAIGAGGARAQGYQHIVVNRGGDGMPYDNVLLNLGGGQTSQVEDEDAPQIASLR